jgi:hypothetical protein
MSGCARSLRWLCAGWLLLSPLQAFGQGSPGDIFRALSSTAHGDRVLRGAGARSRHNVHGFHPAAGIRDGHRAGPTSDTLNFVH